MLFKSRIKWFALVGLVLSVTSILVHLLLAKYSSGDLVQYHARTFFSEEFIAKLGQKVDLSPVMLYLRPLVGIFMCT